MITNVNHQFAINLYLIQLLFRFLPQVWVKSTRQDGGKLRYIHLEEFCASKSGFFPHFSYYMCNFSSRDSSRQNVSCAIHRTQLTRVIACSFSFRAGARGGCPWVESHGGVCRTFQVCGFGTSQGVQFQNVLRCRVSRNLLGYHECGDF